MPLPYRSRMTTVASLEQSLVEVLPGEEAVCRLQIRNTATIVEAYDLQVLGDPAEWTVIDPPVLTVYPGTEGSASIRFRPPRTGGPAAGDLNYAVRITPTEQPEHQVVPEGTVRVLPLLDTTAEIVPRTSHGRWWMTHEVAVDNRGNLPVSVTLTAADPDNRMAIAARPPTLMIRPGEAEFTKVRVRPRRLLWRGQPASQPFRVVVTPADAPEIQLDATAIQKPLVPPGAGRLLALLLILFLVGAGLWFTVLRPAVKSAANEAVAEPIASLRAHTEKLDQQINPPKPTNPAPLPNPEPPQSPAPPPANGARPPGSTAFNQTARNFANGSGGTANAPYTAPTGRTVVLTDFYLQNPQGDAGKLELVVDGTPYFTWSLANFRDLDYHAVSPIELPPGKTVTVRLTCLTPGPALAGFSNAQCRVWVLLSGYQKPTP